MERQYQFLRRHADMVTGNQLVDLLEFVREILNYLRLYETGSITLENYLSVRNPSESEKRAIEKAISHWNSNRIPESLDPIRQQLTTVEKRIVNKLLDQGRHYSKQFTRYSNES